MISLSEKSSKNLERDEIRLFCHSYAGETNFAFVNAILSLNINLCIDICQKMSLTKHLDEWLGSVMGLLRNNLYIKYLKEYGSSESQIANAIKIHPYVLKN